MRRIHEEDLNTPEYYDDVIWTPAMGGTHGYDPVRVRWLLDVLPHDWASDFIEVGPGWFGALEYYREFSYPRSDAIARAVGVDFSKASRDRVLAAWPDVEWFLHDCTEPLPFSDGEFDALVAGEIIEHMEYPAAFAAELCRVLVPGGRLRLSTVDTTCRQAKLLEYPEHLWEFEPEDLVGFFSPFGTARYELVGNYHAIDFERSAEPCQ